MAPHGAFLQFPPLLVSHLSELEIRAHIRDFTGLITARRVAGAIAGLVAGSLGATAYAFHCPDDSVPFIAIW